ncbi:hypothetical protein HMPREF9103_00855 [Lentilactobacillus parafarraginis F0439]|uniref:Uncharacterized protein n=1 Tax=Lentilactobacillus parafarraginis F0439 TaxID=797515 RepID=G9ZMA7_9LACO|nr:hypothetical protein HMPREF9103_00855 [Lentilactobacillus parafarraginis F0439]
MRIEIKKFRNVTMGTGNKVQALVGHGKIKGLLIDFKALPVKFFHEVKSPECEAAWVVRCLSVKRLKSRVWILAA